MAQDPFVTKTNDYSDLDLDFIAHPNTKDIVRKTGADAIKRSVRNLIFYNFYDKPFDPTFGSNVRGLLFENADPLISVNLSAAIRDVLAAYEPRIRVVDVTVTDDIDANGFNVRLEYVILNRNITTVSTMFLERIR